MARRNKCQLCIAFIQYAYGHRVAETMMAKASQRNWYRYHGHKTYAHDTTKGASYVQAHGSGSDNSTRTVLLGTTGTGLPSLRRRDHGTLAAHPAHWQRRSSARLSFVSSRQPHGQERRSVSRTPCTISDCCAWQHLHHHKEAAPWRHHSRPCHAHSHHCLQPWHGHSVVQVGL